MPPKRPVFKLPKLPPIQTSKPLGGQRFWKFDPHPILGGHKHHSSNKINQLIKNVSKNTPTKGAVLDKEGRQKLHPLIRERLPKGSSRDDFAKEITSLKEAKHIYDSNLRGGHFYPTVLDLGELATEGEIDRIYPIRAFMEVPGYDKHPLVPTTHVIRKNPGDRYSIEAHGMQFTDLRSKEDRERDTTEHNWHDIRAGISPGMHKTFDEGAPSLGLALTSALLMREGDKYPIGMPGKDLGWWRKGTKRPQSKEILKEAQYYPLSKQNQKRIKQILDNWDSPDMGGIKVRKILKDIYEDGGTFFDRAHGVPKVVLERNYSTIPKKLGARKTTAEDALGPLSDWHMHFQWGVTPEDAKNLTGLKAYDMRVPAFKELSKFIKPMSEKEIEIWQNDLKKRGHDVENIERASSSDGN